MKKSFTIAAVVMLCLYNQAQSQSVEVEAFLRPAVTSMHGNAIVEESFDLTLHFSAGIGTNILVSNTSLINVGLILERKGGHGTSTVTWRDQNNTPVRDVQLKTVHDYDYLTLPILYNLRFGEKMKIQFGAGLYVAYLLRRIQIDETELQRVESESKDGIKACDFGLSASVEIYLPISKKLDAVMGINDYYGLLNISTVPVLGDRSIRQQSFGMSLGLKYTVN